MVEIGEMGAKMTTKIVYAGEPLVTYLEVETATNMKPGRLVKKGTTDADIVVNDSEVTPIGWLGFEQAAHDVKDNSSGLNGARSGTYAAGDHAPVLYGGHFTILASVIASAAAVAKGRPVYAAADGQVTIHGTSMCGIARESIAAGGGNCLVESII